MPLRRPGLLLMLLAAGLSVPTASAQTVADRIVGSLNAAGARVALWSVTGGELAMLGDAAGVAVGFDGLSPERFSEAIVATGQPLRAVLDALVNVDPRYEWREDDGVILVRPRGAWADDASLLHTPIGAMSLKDMTPGDVAGVLAKMFGTESLVSGRDSRRFSVEVRDGATLFEALNAIAREHGALSWSLEPSAHPTPGFPLTMTLFVGGNGDGAFAIPAGAKLRSVIPSLGTRPEVMGSELPILERPVVPRVRNGLSLMYTINPMEVFALADAVGVPIGFERLPASEPPLPTPVTGINLGGTLGRALDDIVAFDPRYEWRDVGGMVVLRPARAWVDPDNPLYRGLPAMRLDDVTLSEAAAALRAALGDGEFPPEFPDTRRFSINVPQGWTVLDVLTAISRAHGELAWVWEQVPADERANHRNPYRVWITIPASGLRAPGIRSSFQVP